MDVIISPVFAQCLGRQPEEDQQESPSSRFLNFHFSIVVHNLNMPEVEEENPWAGSLRHVDDHRKGKARKEEKEDTYGNAPWMGTLRYRTYRDIYIFFDQKKLTMNASQARCARQ